MHKAHNEVTDRQLKKKEPKAEFHEYRASHR